MRFAIQLTLLILFVDSSIIGIDLGSEYIKVAIGKSGQSWQSPKYLLNFEHSKRKTPNLLTIRDSRERFMGFDAKKMKFPETTVERLTLLLGLPYHEKYIDLFGDVYMIPIQLVKNEFRDAFSVRIGEETYPVEELVSMLIKKTKELVDREEEVELVVITATADTPTRLGAIVRAGGLAGLQKNNLRVIPDGIAVAVHYGVEKYKDMKELQKKSEGDDITRVLFYDFGSSELKVTLARYEGGDGKNDLGSVTVEDFEVGEIGGVHIDRKLMEHLLDLFVDGKENKKNLKNEILTSHPQVVARLMVESNRMKKELSMNTESFGNLESLFQGESLYKKVVTRASFKEICKPLFPLLVEPIETILKENELSIYDISSVEFFGGNSRISFVKNVLEDHFNGYPGERYRHSVNYDEAAAMGAVYYGVFKGFSDVVVSSRLFQSSNLGILTPADLRS